MTQWVINRPGAAQGPVPRSLFLLYDKKERRNSEANHIGFLVLACIELNCTELNLTHLTITWFFAFHIYQSYNNMLESIIIVESPGRKVEIFFFQRGPYITKF